MQVWTCTEESEGKIFTFYKCSEHQKLPWAGQGWWSIGIKWELQVFLTLSRTGMEYWDRVRIADCSLPWAGQGWSIGIEWELQVFLTLSRTGTAPPSQISSWLCGRMAVPGNSWILCPVPGADLAPGVPAGRTEGGTGGIFWHLGVCFEPSHLAGSTPWVLLLEMLPSGIATGREWTLEITEMGFFHVPGQSCQEDEESSFPGFFHRLCVLLLDGENITESSFHQVQKERSPRDFTGRNTTHLNMQS